MGLSHQLRCRGATLDVQRVAFRDVGARFERELGCTRGTQRRGCGNDRSGAENSGLATGDVHDCSSFFFLSLLLLGRSTAAADGGEEIWLPNLAALQRDFQASQATYRAMGPAQRRPRIKWRDGR